MKERFIDWMLDRYESIEQVCGIWVPSRYSESIRGFVFAIFFAAIVISVGSVILLLQFLPWYLFFSLFF